ncbi:MAG: hypothetical protein K8E66_08430, partial [Phycisphaerales bacterium]|nr:hypothetical protein [Phycisphaerales bacterium]
MTTTHHTSQISAPKDATGLTNAMQTEAGRTLLEKIRRKQARVAIMGLGYVGLPLVQAIHNAGFPVIGFDIDDKKIEMLRRGETYLKHLGADLSKSLSNSDRFVPTSSAADLADADIVVLCVPTPLGEHREPDLSFVLGSTEIAGRALREGQLVVLESTTYPGTTRDEMAPTLQKAAAARGLDLVIGRDFFVAYSPEREDPGRANVTTSSIPKLVGGIDEDSGRLASAFYRSFIERVHDVSNAEASRPLSSSIPPT